MKGYKVFNPDWTCRHFQYEVGKTYKHKGKIGVCVEGFHFCEKVANCFNYYKFNSSNKVAEIEAIGNIETDGEKSVTDEIRIVRELNWFEVLELANEGKNCTGYDNIGDYNAGHHNSGNCNTGCNNLGSYNTGCLNFGRENTGDSNMGSHNTGYINSGFRNTGNDNIGNYNCGNHNAGSCNSGNYNSGNYNAGSWNSCDCSTGFFNSVSQSLYAFNKPLTVSRTEFLECEGIEIMRCCFSNHLWIPACDITEVEKENHPEYKFHGGYFKTLSFKEACKRMWAKFSDTKKQAVKEIPNFDADVFKEITGIDVNK